MSKESRANLIFVVLFLLISIPGLIMLVRKKMDPTVGPMWLPVPAKEGLVYIDPIDAPPSMARITPAATAAWVRELTRERFGPHSPPVQSAGDDRTEPLMSDERLAQVAGIGPDVGGMRIALIVWNLPRESTSAMVSLAAEQHGKPIAVDEVVVESIDVPREVKRDLQESGIPAPPLRVQWVSAAIRAQTVDAPIRLSLRCEVDGEIISDTLTLK